LDYTTTEADHYHNMLDKSNNVRNTGYKKSGED
jgi:hypothetical protein